MCVFSFEMSELSEAADGGEVVSRRRKLQDEGTAKTGITSGVSQARFV